MTEIDPKTVLDTPMLENDAGVATIREYLAALAEVAWDDKRPFGNSGWRWELWNALYRAGYITGVEDYEGYLEEADEEAGERLILSAIEALGRGA